MDMLSHTKLPLKIGILTDSVYQVEIIFNLSILKMKLKIKWVGMFKNYIALRLLSKFKL